MFDVAPTEFLLVAVVALLVIGPKELPRVMRTVGHWVGKARGLARQFRAGFDEMVRESELKEMEAKWREENERIMREHPAIPDTPMTPIDPPPPAPAPPRAELP
jgi:sec-independent protein translocase protein TatB